MPDSHGFDLHQTLQRGDARRTVLVPQPAPDPWVSIRLACLRDERLSFKATGVLLYLLTLPPGTRLSVAELSRLKLDGRDSVGTGLRELEQCGYVRRYQDRKQNGQLGDMQYFVYHHPNQDFNTDSPVSPSYSIDPQNDTPADLKPTEGSCGFTAAGKPVNGLPVDGKPVNGESEKTTALPHTSQVPVEEELKGLLNQDPIVGKYNFGKPQSIPTEENSAVETHTLIISSKNSSSTGKGGAGGNPKPRLLTDEQQLIWDKGWAPGYELMNGFAPSKPSPSVCRDFKQVCTLLLDATRQNAAKAAELLLSIFERRETLDDWQRKNCLSKPALFAKNFDAIRTQLKSAKRGSTPSPTLATDADREEALRKMQERQWQSSINRGLDPELERQLREQQQQRTDNQFNRPPRRADDLIPDGE